MGDDKKPDFSNVQSGSASTAPPAPKADFSNVQSGVETTAPTAPQTYTVNKGDTLSKIAKEFYGNANAYMKIFEANKGTLKDPDEIKPGQVLTIPAK